MGYGEFLYAYGICSDNNNLKVKLKVIQKLYTRILYHKPSMPICISYEQFFFMWPRLKLEYLLLHSKLQVNLSLFFFYF